MEKTISYYASYEKKKKINLRLPELGAEAELKALSRLLGKETPKTEFLAFMREYPHLMNNPEIRNFFDAIFFSTETSFNLKGIDDEYALVAVEISKLLKEGG